MYEHRHVCVTLIIDNAFMIHETANTLLFSPPVYARSISKAISVTRTSHCEQERLHITIDETILPDVGVLRRLLRWKGVSCMKHTRHLI